jgi:hypothetical protein
MSLDIFLTMPGAQIPVAPARIFIREDGQTTAITRAEWDARHPGTEPVTLRADPRATTDQVYTANITHNLAEMAQHAGLYGVLWEPETCGITHARDLVGPLRIGLTTLAQDPAYFSQFTPPNGWGSYTQLALFTAEYLVACEQWLAAEVSVWR